MKKEIWKKIDGFKKYEISNLGEIRIKNFAHTGKNKIITPIQDDEGCDFVILESNGKSQIFYIEELLKMYFNDEVKNHNTNKIKKVKCIELDKVFISAKIASIETGVNKNSIIKCCNGKQKTAGKMHWEYLK